MTHRHLSDHDIETLPLSSGRAELLEEIMSTPVRTSLASTSPRGPDPTPRRTRWLVPLASAAVVAGLAVVPVWLGSGEDASHDTSSDQGAAQAGPQPVFPVLGAPGWQVSYANATSDGGSLEYRSAGATLAIGSAPVSVYEGRVADRSTLADPPGPGDPIEVDGLTAQVWAYSDYDHTAIREPQAGQWSEFRGQGMSRADFVELLGRVRFVDRATYEASLPSRFVTTAEREAVVKDMVAGIRGAMAPDHALTPGGSAPDVVTSDTSRYGLMTSVAGTVACGWVEQYAAARAAGDAEAMTDAAAALATSREWPVLQEMEDVGDYSEVVWLYADEMAAGQGVRGYQEGLGCQ